MRQVTLIRSPPKNSITTVPSPFPLFSEPYHVSRGHSMDETSLSSLLGLGYDLESVPRSGSTSEYSPRNKSIKFLKCLVPRWLQKWRKDTALGDDSRKTKVVKVSKDYQQCIDTVQSVHCRKMEFLKEEVAGLEDRLVYEQVLNEVLIYTHLQGSCSAVPIPTFLPPTVKGLLAEMGKVDDEIARLERQISELEKRFALEQEVVRGLKSRNNLQHQQQKN